MALKPTLPVRTSSTRAFEDYGESDQSGEEELSKEISSAQKKLQTKSSLDGACFGEVSRIYHKILKWNKQ